MRPEFTPAPHFDLGMNLFEPPQVSLTADGKLLKIDWSASETTYHLPETFVSVKFNDLASAFKRHMEGPWRIPPPFECSTTTQGNDRFQVMI